jgi:hypothetical protein
MSDALHRLAARALGRPDTLKPALRGLFVDDGIGAGLQEEDAGGDVDPFTATDAAPRPQPAADRLRATPATAPRRTSGEPAAAAGARGNAPPQPPAPADAPLLPPQHHDGARHAPSPPSEPTAVVPERTAAASPEAPASPRVQPAAPSSTPAPPLPPSRAATAASAPEAALLVPDWVPSEGQPEGDPSREADATVSKVQAPSSPVVPRRISPLTERAHVVPDPADGPVSRRTATTPPPTSPDGAPAEPLRATAARQVARAETAAEPAAGRTSAAERPPAASPLEASVVGSADTRPTPRDADPQTSETLLLPHRRRTRRGDGQDSADLRNSDGQQNGDAARTERFAPTALRQPQQRDGADERPVVHVTIGRVEVRAAPPPPPPPATARAGWSPPVVSLDAYLKRGAR